MTRGEINNALAVALSEKRPAPPVGWCASRLDKELWKATREYEPDALLRQRDALESSLFYLVDYASRMPERVNLSAESNPCVRRMLEELADEIEKITSRPHEIINERGKLKAWLHAILSVQTCLIYREETERFIAEEDAAKRAARAAQTKSYKARTTKPDASKWQSDLAKNIFQKANAKISLMNDSAAEQPSLF